MTTPLPTQPTLSPPSSSSFPSSRPVVLITGGHSGIGLYASTHLALRGFYVLIASRSAQKVNEAIEGIEQDHPELKGKGVLKHVQLDLTDLKSVRGCVAEVEGGVGRLDVLINNACLHGGGTPYLILPNGIEQMVCTNFVGPALLTSLFLPLLSKTTAEMGGDVRILNVTSDQHTAAPKNIHFTSLEDFNRPYSKNPSGMAGCRVRYGTTKLLLNFLTTHLTSSLLPALPPSSSSQPKPILALSLDPGWTLTPSSLATVPSFLSPVLKLFLSPLEKGGEVLVWGATSDAVRSKALGGKMIGREGKVLKETGTGGIGEGERERAREVWRSLEEGVWEGR